MTAILNLYIPLHCYYSLHIDPCGGWKGSTQYPFPYLSLYTIKLCSQIHIFDAIGSWWLRGVYSVSIWIVFIDKYTLWCFKYRFLSHGDEGCYSITNFDSFWKWFCTCQISKIIIFVTFRLEGDFTEVPLRDFHENHCEKI